MENIGTRSGTSIQASIKPHENAKSAVLSCKKISSHIFLWCPLSDGFCFLKLSAGIFARCAIASTETTILISNKLHISYRKCWSLLSERMLTPTHRNLGNRKLEIPSRNLVNFDSISVGMPLKIGNIAKYLMQIYQKHLYLCAFINSSAHCNRFDADELQACKSALRWINMGMGTYICTSISLSSTHNSPKNWNQTYETWQP